ncbi:hypothetical protein A2U01_0005421 [Trifolium medium]|uniref:Uncharacterized protein n=1 Tax=Trifolium medium TaxID=97028 RepID=A0A392MC09_9FABA|nr:hypothetical protein [Trifolium medium]
MVRWNAQGGTGMILNVNGSSIGNPGVSGFGGLIWSYDGAWVYSCWEHRIFEHPSCKIIDSIPWLNFGLGVGY